MEKKVKTGAKEVVLHPWMHKKFKCEDLPPGKFVKGYLDRRHEFERMEKPEGLK